MSATLTPHSGLNEIASLPGVGITIAAGQTVPTDGSAGYAYGCIFQHIDGSGVTDALYVNYGSSTSCDFDYVANAAKVTIADAGAFTAQTTVEAALAELYQNLFSATGGCINLPLTAWREVDANGDVANAAANGGVLASDTTPILLADAAEAMCIQWASSNSDPLAIAVYLPDDMDRTADAILSIRVLSGGTTNAPSFTVETSWDGSAKVSDTATGTAVATIQTANATIAAADIPDTAVALTVGLTPGAHTTDAWSVYGVALKYKRKLMTV